MNNSQKPYFMIKRIFDFTCGAVMSILLLPFFIFVALIIKLESKGPILFRQTRVGLNSKPFTIYKFRTMVISAPENAPSKELQNPEVFLTRSGKILRKLSIDELPQLINILKNDMSLIGPRPVIPEENELIQLRKQLGVDKIKPGVTGLAQVVGRDFLDVHEKAEYDLKYVQTMSLSMDLKIILLTVLKIIKREHISH